MKKKLLLLLGVCLVVTSASSAFAAVTLKRLGDHPFIRPAMTTEADLRTMVEKHSADLQAGFAKAGTPELFPEFMSQFPNAKIETVQVAPGQRFDWMLFRKNGKGPVKTVKDVTWGGDAPFDAFKFYIDKDGQRYEFIVPSICGNLSLMAVEAIPAQANLEPVCNMKLSSSEIKCGQVITVDASGSTDADGTIAEVVFQLLDSSNAVVTEKIDNEAPFVQEFTIPCESPRYTVKTVVIDSNGAKSSPADCTQTVTTVAQLRGGPVVDVGLAHQFDPANYAFARVGYEFPLTDKLTAMGLIGGFAKLDGDDGDSSFTADALLNYYFNDKMFVGGGVGFWSGNDGKADLIVNLGYLVYEKPGSFKTSIFVEGRCQADELISSYASRLGVGVRFQF
ncbi:MAG: hypothetical protein Q8R88_16715 [Desulfoprunum sp.]|nr:hypothetical protein [Desulfoprunum sp.]